ncbi:unnamed protein product [Protopolystoma xenopodis]|uniref:Uncharacterized protein n=1 Tax=Protopolystoma xenopodis TaxID=117903 RepID=A0A3S5A885_9PLAT|nr:unnamed protein product [Protopolystoma xenopodis]
MRTLDPRDSPHLLGLVRLRLHADAAAIEELTKDLVRPASSRSKLANSKALLANAKEEEINDDALVLLYHQAQAKRDRIIKAARLFLDSLTASERWAGFCPGVSA